MAGVTFSSRSASRIARTVIVTEQERRGFLSQGIRTGDVSRSDGTTRAFWSNTETAQDCPAYGLLELAAAAFASGEIAHQGARPTGDFTLPHAVNSHIPVAAEEFGGLSFESVVEVLYDNAQTPAFGETWGPATNTWELTKDRPGFTILGGIDSDKQTVRALRADASRILAKSGGGGVAARSGDTPGTGTVDVHYVNDSGDLTDAGFDVTAKNLSSDAVAVSAWLILLRVGNAWFIDYEDC